MNTKFTLALLATAVMGRTREEIRESRRQHKHHSLGVNNDAAEFQDFIGKFGKSYTSVAQMGDRLNIWLENKRTVDHLNASNAGTGVVFGMNETSDMSQEEFLKRQGLVKPWNFEEKKSSSSDSSSSHHRHSGRLGADQSISWVKKGKVHPVKNQGGCGSCWAFAAATVQETMQAIKNDTNVVRLSEQEGVDCDANSYGCYGGWMSNYWQMSAEIGSQANETYKYEGVDGACRNQQGKTIESRAKAGSMRHVSVSEMKNQLQEGPMSIAVAAGNDCWRYYQEGILSKENNCPSGLDHGVVIIGLEETGSQPYWIIQNSWGTGWGNQGFIWIAVEDGDGTSDMNTWVEVMDVEPGYPKKEDGDDTNPDPPTPDPEPTPNKNCSIDESMFDLGPGMCTGDQDCKGDRVCSEEFWYCVGYSNCADDWQEESEAKCKIMEQHNPWGPSECTHEFHCKGDRFCNSDYICQGASNCPDDEMTPAEKCMVDEMNTPSGLPNSCTTDNECKGERTCSIDGMCEGYCNCP